MNAVFLRVPAVLARYGIARSTLYALIQENAFPAPVHCGRSALWKVDELLAYEQRLTAARDGSVL